MKPGHCRACGEALYAPQSPEQCGATIRVTARTPGAQRFSEFKVCHRCTQLSTDSARANGVQAALFAELKSLVQ